MLLKPTGKEEWYPSYIEKLELMKKITIPIDRLPNNGTKIDFNEIPKKAKRVLEDLTPYLLDNTWKLDDILEPENMK